MNQDDMRDRLLLPVLIPVGALAFVGFFALAMGQILLNVSKAVATAIALMIAFNMLVAFTVVALKPNIGKFLMATMGGIAVVPLLLGAAAAAGVIDIADEEHGGEEAQGPVIEIAAANIAFDKAALEAPADTPFEIKFSNDEAVPHNVAILTAPGSTEALFRGAIITGPKETNYKVEALAAGNYPFQCDVHPNMAGTVTIV